MAKTETPSPHQAAALKLALPAGALRRLPGGFWVGDDHRAVDRTEIDKGFVPAAYVGTNTVEACIKRGWFVRDGVYRTPLTEAGRAVVAVPGIE